MTAPVPASSFPHRTDGAAPPPMDPSVRVDCTAAAPSNPASDDGLRRMRGIAEASLSCPWEEADCEDCEGQGRVEGGCTVHDSPNCPCGGPMVACPKCNGFGHVDVCVTCGAPADRARNLTGPDRGLCCECIEAKE